MAIPQGPNQRWSLDFAADALVDGRRLRILAVVDDFSRGCLCLAADTSLPGLRAARELDAVVARRGKPMTNRLGQRHGAHRDRDAALGSGASSRVALHRARSAHLWSSTRQTLTYGIGYREGLQSSLFADIRGRAPGDPIARLTSFRNL
jgi:transposase InsO family protein